MRNDETGLLRLAAPKESNSKSRWMYEWKGQRGAKYLDAIEFTPGCSQTVRPSVLITEEGNVITMEFPNLVISIRQKPGK